MGAELYFFFSPKRTPSNNVINLLTYVLNKPLKRSRHQWLTNISLQQLILCSNIDLQGIPSLCAPHILSTGSSRVTPLQKRCRLSRILMIVALASQGSFSSLIIFKLWIWLALASRHLLFANYSCGLVQLFSTRHGIIDTRHFWQKTTMTNVEKVELEWPVNHHGSKLIR